MFATRGQVKGWIKSTVGTDEDVKLNETVERIRLMIFEAYMNVDRVPHYNLCVCLQDYCENPCNESASTIKGFTLPWNMEAVEGAWHGSRGNTVDVISDWREFVQSAEFNGGSKIIYRQAGLFPMERDITPCGECVHISFLSSNGSDVGKSVLVEYINAAGETITNMVELKKSKTRTNELVKRVIRVVLPEGLLGEILVTKENDNTILSEYHSTEMVPQYSRYYVEGVNTQTIYIRASAKYQPLRCDNDLVEIDNANTAIYYAKSVMQHNISKPTNASIQAAEFYQQKGEAGLVRDKSKESGKRNKRYIEVPTVARAGRLGRRFR